MAHMTNQREIPVGVSAWQAEALECDTLRAKLAETKAQRDELLVALRLMQSHYDDLSNNNPGLMAKLVLQDYALWNEACMAMDAAIARAEGKAAQ